MKNLRSGKETNKSILDETSKLTISMWNATCYSTSTTGKSINYIPRYLKASDNWLSSFKNSTLSSSFFQLSEFQPSPQAMLLRLPYRTPMDTASVMQNIESNTGTTRQNEASE